MNKTIEELLKIADKGIDIWQEKLTGGSIYYDEFVDKIHDKIFEIAKDEEINDKSLSEVERKELEKELKITIAYENTGLEVFDNLNIYFSDEEAKQIENDFKEYVYDGILQTKYDYIEIKDYELELGNHDKVKEYAEKISELEPVIDKLQDFIKAERKMSLADQLQMAKKNQEKNDNMELNKKEYIR